MIPDAAPPNPTIVWSRELTAERYPLPLSPLGWSNLSAVFDRGVRAFGEFMGMEIAAKEQLATTINGWVVANPAAFDFRGRFKIRLSRSDQFAVVRAACGAILGTPHPMRGLKEIIGHVRSPEKSRTRLGNRLESPTVRLVGEAILRYLRPLAAGLRGKWPETVARFRGELEAVDHALPAATSSGEVLALADRLQAAMIAYVEPDLVIFAIREIASLFLAELATLAELPDPKRVAVLLGGALEENVTLATHRRFLELAERLGAREWAKQPGNRCLEALSAAQRADLDDFLHEAGHLTSSWDIRNPTWGEDPARFCELLAAMAGAAVAGGAMAAHPVTDRERHEAEKSFEKRLAGYPFALGLFRELAGVLRTFLVIDEEHHFHTGRIIPVTRRVIHRLGCFLVEAKLVQNPDDLFWLTDGEVRQMLKEQGAGWTGTDVAKRIEERRTAWEKACRDGWQDGGTADPAPGNSRDQSGPRRGLGVSPGRARGKIRRVAGLADVDRVCQGEVLLVRSPDPFFVVLYPRVAALVAETGALLSHGAIAARESRLPAVFGIKGAWRDWPDGTLVEVDGNTGKVRPFSECIL